METGSSIFFKRSYEYLPKEEIDNLPNYVRGIYVLYQSRDDEMSVMYVGMVRGKKAGVKGRLRKHNTNKDGWTHFSVYEVHDNTPERFIEELEGFIRHLYRQDCNANNLNAQKGYKPLHELARNTKTQ